MVVWIGGLDVNPWFLWVYEKPHLSLRTTYQNLQLEDFCSDSRQPFAIFPLVLDCGVTPGGSPETLRIPFLFGFLRVGPTPWLPT